ncbi:lipid kinase [Leptospira kobayashii]|uniref:Lipid kinase n=1 Tax=Leptospira kobayashii TaxID=1917830 RepID=A0ABN6KHL2_9LEPT|nr:diacylglycerol kinase family protein [Leptospira kobayashii]BDA80773.1 lipid kinase [Leptospira kobayashii]
MKMKIILNPVSGGGISGKVWKKVKSELDKQKIEYDFEETTPSLTAGQIASKSIKAGQNWIVGIGGDGTLSNIVNGFFENGKLISKDAVFSPIPAGRGNDFIKTLRVNKKPSEALKQILNGKIRKIDVIETTYTKEDKSTGKYMSINLADFGMGGEVVYRVNRSKLANFIGGKGVFFLYTLVCLLTYKNKKVHLKINNKETIDCTSRIIVCANGEYAGGGMWFAPKAKLEDGLFDLLIIEDIGRLETLAKFGKLYKGQAEGQPKIISRTAFSLEASSEEDIFIDVDGENMGQLPASFKIIPSIISVKC